MTTEIKKLHKINPIHIIPIKYGLLAAIISIILFLVLYYFEKNPLLIPAIFDYRIILFPIILVFAVRDFKENINNGYLHFWQGMSIGIQTILITAFSMAMFILVFGSIFEKNFVLVYIDQLTEQIQSVDKKLIESIGEETISRTLELLPTTTIFDLAIDYFLKSLPYGIFLTIIISLILRKKTF